MKKLIYSIIAIAMTCSAFSTVAQNRWNITAGGSISHQTYELFDGYSVGWGGGAFLNGGYELNFNKNWSLTPQIEIEYINNGAIIKNKLINDISHSSWRDFWNLKIPVIASFRFKTSDFVGFRFGVGPYLQESLAGRKYKYIRTEEKEKESLHGSFQNRFNVGIQGEAAVETGNHLSYMFRVNYPFAKENWMGETITLSLGIRYSF